MRSRIFLSVIFLGVFLRLDAQETKISNNTTLAEDEAEAHIAINPTDPSKMVMGYMETSSAELNFRMYISDDAGDTWSPSDFDFRASLAEDFPDYSEAGGGDIIFAYDKTGLLYCSYLFLMRHNTSSDTAILAGHLATSMDNGKTFELEPGNDHFFGIGKLNPFNNFAYAGEGLCDRQWMAVDLTDGPYQNRLYVGYINYRSTSPFAALRVKTKDPGVMGVSDPEIAYTGSAQFTNIMVDHNGVLHYTFANLANDWILHVSSSDGGKTFTPFHLVAISDRVVIGNGEKAFVNNEESAAPSLAIDGENNLHLVWTGLPSGVFPKGYYSKSTDGGVNWSTPLDLSTKFDGNVFQPVVSADGDRVSISAYVLDVAKDAEYWVLPSGNGGEDFEEPVKVSGGVSRLGFYKTKFIGHYSSSVRKGCVVYSAWTDCRNVAEGCKQYVSKVNECNVNGIQQELTPLESTFRIKSMYPNPVAAKLNVEVTSENGNVLQAYVYDVNGKETFVQSFDVKRGENKLLVPVEDFAEGSYILKLVDTSNTLITRAFLKQ